MHEEFHQGEEEEYFLKLLFHTEIESLAALSIMFVKVEYRLPVSILLSMEEIEF